MSKWPKQLPPLTPEQKRINDEFMEHWHELFPQRYRVADSFCHRYVVRQSRPGFRRTLEIGCGLGEHLNYERLTPEQEREYVGVDTRENMLQRVRERFPRIQTCLGDCQKLDYPDGRFDRIIAINVLEHLPDLPAALRELARLCDPRGSVLAVIPCEGSLAYSLARQISAKRIYEKRYKLPYDTFIKQEHINMAQEIFEEVPAFFEVAARTFFPIPLPFEFCNLFIGMELRPRGDAAARFG